jgi:hypothetical protein
MGHHLAGSLGHIRVISVSQASWNSDTHLSSAITHVQGFPKTRSRLAHVFPRDHHWHYAQPGHLETSSHGARWTQGDPGNSPADQRHLMKFLASLHYPKPGIGDLAGGKIPPCPALPCPALPCLALPCPTLPCHRLGGVAKEWPKRAGSEPDRPHGFDVAPASRPISSRRNGQSPLETATRPLSFLLSLAMPHFAAHAIGSRESSQRDESPPGRIGSSPPGAWVVCLRGKDDEKVVGGAGVALGLDGTGWDRGNDDISSPLCEGTAGNSRRIGKSEVAHVVRGRRLWGRTSTGCF